MGKLYARCFCNKKKILIGSSQTAEFEILSTDPIQELVNIRLVRVSMQFITVKMR